MTEDERAEELITYVANIIWRYRYPCGGKRPRKYKQWAIDLAVLICAEMCRDGLIDVPEQKEFLRRRLRGSPKPSDN